MSSSENHKPLKNDSQSYSATAEVGSVRKRRSRAERWWLALKEAPLSAWFGMIVVLGYIFVALFAPWIAPYGEAEIFPAPFAPWDETHRFGTCLLYTSPSPRDRQKSRMPSSA